MSKESRTEIKFGGILIIQPASGTSYEEQI